MHWISFKNYIQSNSREQIIFPCSNEKVKGMGMLKEQRRYDTWNNYLRAYQGMNLILLCYLIQKVWKRTIYVFFPD